MTYLVYKALHIIGVVSWFAGLLYIVRLFIYHFENTKDPKLCQQFALMERRLWYGITNPAMVVSLVFGLLLAETTDAWKDDWFQVKFASLVLLLAYHFRCGQIRKALVAGYYGGSSKGLRVFNELGTVFLIWMVFLAVTKSIGVAFGGVLGFLGLGLAIMLALRWRSS